MKNHQAGRSSFDGLLGIKSLWNKSQHTTDVSPIERTFSNESTIEVNPAVVKHPPPSPTSVMQCDIFRPLRESFFPEEMENMLTLKRARPVTLPVCCGSLLDIEDEDEDEEDGGSSPVPLKRQDALLTSVEMLERAEDDGDSLIGTRILDLGEGRTKFE